MPATYEKIATTTLGSAQSTFSFNSIPSTYTDLRLVMTGLSSTANNQGIQFNSDTATNYSSTILYGTGSSAASFRYTGATYIHIASDIVVGPTTYPVLVTVDVFNYAGSTNKTCLITTSLDLNGSGETVARVGLWRSTSAINSITFMRTAGNFSIGTTATLYGILKA
jgi:hypothetical protein